MLAGTPRTFRQLMDEMDQPIIVNKSLRQTAKDVMNHLEFLVFDEADRLFQTEEVARHYQEQLQKRDSTSKDGNMASGLPPFHHLALDHHHQHHPKDLFRLHWHSNFWRIYPVGAGSINEDLSTPNHTRLRPHPPIHLIGYESFLRLLPLVAPCVDN